MMKTSHRSNLINNTMMLMIFSVVKIIFPLILLPYLTRVLSIEAYGTVSFIKSYMIYGQLFIDFGFILSSVKAIVEAKFDKESIGRITGETVVAKMILSFIFLIFTFAISFFIPVINESLVFTYLSLLVIILSSFLLDFLFRGLEKMHVLVIAFVILKIFSTTLTFVFVKNDSHILLIPLFEILSSFLAVVFVGYTIKKYGIIIKFTHLKNSVLRISESFTYFLSNLATTAFGALNTLVVGIFLLKSDIAIWAVSMQVISAVLAIYGPITNGIYPEMIRSKKISLIKKTLYIFMPLIFIGSIVMFYLSEMAILIIAGSKYIEAASIINILIGVLIISFPSMILGWPSLGAIDKAKETTKTTIFAALIQVIGISVLLLTNNFNLISLAIVRVITEFSLLAARFYYVKRYIHLFS